MKKLICGFCGLLFYTVNSQATLNFSEDFNSYANGNLTNQGPWLQTAPAANPIQVNGGKAILPTTGQDVYAAFGSPVNFGVGESFYYGLTINVISATAAGDYFFHVSNPAGTTSAFFERLFARSSGAGFQLGLLDASGTGSATTWGSTVLSLNTDYRVVVAQNSITGPNNDTFNLYVDPTDSTEANNTAYLSHGWTSTTVAEVATYAAVNLRQGGSTTTPSVSVDNILVSKIFSDLTPVPEPSILALAALAGFGMLSLSVFRKRARN